MAFHTLDDLQVKGKRVLVRADLNVPVADGAVTDATRIERQAPTLRELADKASEDGIDPEAQQERNLVDLSTIVGALLLSRATAGDPISEAILAAARRSLDSPDGA